MQKTIRAAQFMYYVPTGQTRLNRKTGQEEDLLSVRHAFFGDVVDIPRDEDIATGVGAGAFEPDEVEQESPVAEEDQDKFSSHDQLVMWIRDDKPTITEVVAAAEGDPAKAEALLLAEQEATGGQPRKGVQEQLGEILEEEEDTE